MSNDYKISSSMKNPSPTSKREEDESSPFPDTDTPSEFDASLECIKQSSNFQHPILIFLNVLDQSGGKNSLKYAGIKKAQQLFKAPGRKGLDLHWNALAKAEMALSNSVESKRFLETTAPASPTPRSLAEYFQQPFANEWQEHELAICQGVLGNVEGHLYMSFPFPSSEPGGVAHVVFNKEDKVPQEGWISKCF